MSCHYEQNFKVNIETAVSVSDSADSIDQVYHEITAHKKRNRQTVTYSQ